MKKILLLGLSHGINDCLAGFVLGSLLFHSLELTEIGISIVIYNIIAFGGQVPFSSILKDHYKPKQWLMASFGLMVLGISVFEWSYKLAILALGVSSAIIHVVGGYETIKETDKALGLGIFASPGVMGLILGGFMAHNQWEILWPAIAICGFIALMTFFLPFSSEQTINPEETKLHFDKHDIWMILILTVIAFRSVVWNVFQLINEGHYETLLIIGFSAMAGKIFGGYFSDIIGHRRYTIWALILSIPFLTFLKNQSWALAFGIFLLQSTVPSTARIMIGYFGKSPMKGISYVFGLPIILSGIIFYTPLQAIISSNIGVFVFLALGVVLLWRENRVARRLRIT